MKTDARMLFATIQVNFCKVFSPNARETRGGRKASEPLFRVLQFVALVAVRMRVTPDAPHRSYHALIAHRVPTPGNDAQAHKP